MPSRDQACDQVLGFTLPDRNARGRVVRLDAVLGQILSAHDYPAPIRDLLSEALVLAGLMGALLKDQGSQLTMQVQSDGGALDLLVCDYRDGELRGYVRHDDVLLAALPDDPSLAELCGRGYLAITFDLRSSGERYQGIVPLEGASLTDACERYFNLSEQVPTCIRVGLKPRPGGMTAGGLLVQHLPDGEEGRERIEARIDHPEWEHVAILSGTVKGAELTEAALPLGDLLWRLFHEEREVRVGEMTQLQRGCRCTVEHFQSVLRRFGEKELAEMRDDQGLISVDCEFCSRVFPIPM